MANAGAAAVPGAAADNEPELPPAAGVEVSGAEGEWAGANGVYAARCFWQGRPGYFHTENADAHIRWFPPKCAWVLLLKAGPRFAAGGSVVDPGMVKPGTWMMLGDDGKWNTAPALRVAEASKEAMEEIEMADALSAREEAKSKPEPTKKPGRSAQVLGSSRQQRPSGGGGAAALSKSKRRRNRKKKAKQKQQGVAAVTTTSAEKIQQLLAQVSIGGQKKGRASRRSPAVEARGATSTGSAATRNPRCFVCFERHGFGECSAAQ